MDCVENSNEYSSLLQDIDPPPFSLINASGNNHALLLGDHAGSAIPDRLQDLGLGKEELARHIAFDVGTQGIIERIAERLNLPALVGNYSRLVVDLNRRLDDPTAFPQTSDETDIPGNHNLTAMHREERVQEIYQPYHSAIERWLDHAQGSHQVPALISIHSFTPALTGVMRPWQIGVLWDKDERIAGALIKRLREYGDINVGDNQPYSGKHIADFTIDHHAEAAGLPCVGIEIRQDLLQSDTGTEQWAGILADTLGKILADQTLYTHLTQPVDPPTGYANP